MSPEYEKVIPSSEIKGKQRIYYLVTYKGKVGERREEENGRQGNGKRAGTSSEIRVLEERNVKFVLGLVEADGKY